MAVVIKIISIFINKSILLAFARLLVEQENFDDFYDFWQIRKKQINMTYKENPSLI